MRICILGTAYPYKGGIAAFNERLAEELQSLGHQVDILTFTLQYPKFFYPGKSQYSDGKKPQHLKITRGINSVNPLTWLVQGRKLKKKKYDLIICKFWLPVMGPSLGSIIRLAKSKNTKVVSIIDNIIPHEKRPGDRPFTNYFVKAVDGFIVMSHKVESDMERFVAATQVEYAAHPVYDNYGDILDRKEALEHLGLEPQFRYVLFFGFIRGYKGLDVLLRSFAKAATQAPNLRLIVAGEFYTDQEQYLQIIEKENLADRVILRTDFIENDEVKYYFSGADIVAQTYKSATQSGISQLAIHFEKPILSTNVGGLPETTIHNKSGYLVNVDENEIAETLITFAKEEDPQLFRAGVQDLKRQFSWKNFTQKIIEVSKVN